MPGAEWWMGSSLVFWFGLDLRHHGEPRFGDEAFTGLPASPVDITLSLIRLPPPSPGIEVFPYSHTPRAAFSPACLQGKTCVVLFRTDESFPWRRWIRVASVLAAAICIPQVAKQVNIFQDPPQASPRMPGDVHGGKAYKREGTPQCLQLRGSHSHAAPIKSSAVNQTF